MIGSLSIQKIVNAYDNHCILGARLKFEDKQSDAKSSHNETLSARMVTMKEFFADPYADDDEVKESKRYPVEQLQFMADNKINDKYSDWGNQSTCEFAIFIPIFQCCFGIIFLVMFIICGRGGHTENSTLFLPKPWRIVPPALIFFLVMTIFSIINTVKIIKGLAIFCENFREQMSDVSCVVAMNHFRITEGLLIMPAVFYVLLNAFTWAILACWSILTLIMIARIVFVVDFQLIRVTVKTCDIGDGGSNVMLRVKEPVESSGNSPNAPLATTDC
jgi:hypothetical protein